MMRHAGGPALFVGTKKADVEVVSRKLKVVGVAPEKSELLLRREHEPHIGVFLRTVEVVGPALIQGDDVAPQAGGGQGFLFDRRHRGPTRWKGLVSRHSGRHRRLDAGRHVCDRHKDVQLKVVALQLIGPRRGGEAIAGVVVCFIAEFMQAVSANVMIGDHQTVGRHKGSGATGVEPDARLLQMEQPLRCQRCGVVLLEAVQGRGVEEPHPLVGPNAGRAKHATGSRNPGP